MPKQSTDHPAGPTQGLSRRSALIGGSAAGLVLLSSAAWGQGALMIRKFGKARWAKEVDNAVVYRNVHEFASHPYTRAFFETPGGGLICNFSLATADYAAAQKAIPNCSTTPISSPTARAAAAARDRSVGRQRAGPGRWWTSIRGVRTTT